MPRMTRIPLPGDKNDEDHDEAEDEAGEAGGDHRRGAQQQPVVVVQLTYRVTS